MSRIASYPIFSGPSTPFGAPRPNPPSWLPHETSSTSSLDLDCSGLPGAFPTDPIPFTFRYPSLPDDHARRGTIRPQMTRWPASDPRYNRTAGRIQHHGSPQQRRRKRRVSLTGATPTEVPTPMSTDQESDPFADDDDPSQFNSIPPSPEEVHDELLKWLHKPISTPKINEGKVYLFRNPDRPAMLKIGSSNDVRQRMNSIRRDCGIPGLERIDIPDIVEVVNYLRAEHLVQADLWHLRRPYRCSACGGRHREWHEVDQALAIKTVQRWMKFMQQKPYNSTGKLTPIWKYLIRRRNLLRPRNGNLNHASQRQYWDHVLCPPSYVDYCRYWLHTVWPFVWDFSWQLSTMVTWLVLFLRFQDMISFSVLAVTVLCSWRGISSHRPSPSKKGDR